MAEDTDFTKIAVTKQSATAHDKKEKRKTHQGENTRDLELLHLIPQTSLFNNNNNNNNYGACKETKYDLFTEETHRNRPLQ